MTAGTLYISFWHMCHSNLPFAQFEKREIPPTEASARIADARGASTLVCTTANDLLSLYGQAERQRYEELRGVLRENCNISINLEDFVGDPDFLNPAMASQMPVSGITIEESDSLLIVDCLYEMTRALRTDTCATSPFRIAVDSLSFNLIEPLHSVDASRRTNERR